MPTISLDDVTWSDFRPGIAIYRLFGDGRAGAAAALLRYDPGAFVPRHEHLGFEVIFLVEGTQTDEEGTLVANQVKVNAPGTCHSVVSRTGCVALLFWEAPVDFRSGRGVES
jgi:anti-sigma factor ChrR (cupin superfamily)